MLLSLENPNGILEAIRLLPHDITSAISTNYRNISNKNSDLEYRLETFVDGSLDVQNILFFLLAGIVKTGLDEGFRLPHSID